jgi:hypothetical protein
MSEISCDFLQCLAIKTPSRIFTKDNMVHFDICNIHIFYSLTKLLKIPGHHSKYLSVCVSHFKETGQKLVKIAKEKFPQENNTFVVGFLKYFFLIDNNHFLFWKSLIPNQ